MSFSLPSAFQWSDSYSLKKACSLVGSAMNVGAYTLMILGDLHPWRIVRKDTRRSEYLTGRLLRLLASVFSVLHAPCSVIDPCSTKRYWEMHSLLYVSFPVPYRWCGAVWSTRVLPNAAVASSTNKRPISWAACMKSFSCDSVPLTLIFLLFHHCC